jgi:ABC-type dipeptide/oligopeptide/nickel transport system permease subunit
MAVAQIEKERTTPPVTQTKHRSELARAWSRFRGNRLAVAGLIFIMLLCLVAIFADFVAPFDPINDYVSGKRGAPAEGMHLLGYDLLGRDLLSRIIFGTRVALIVGLISSAISVIIGVAVGAIAGYFSGRVDTILSRLVDTLMAFPILALLIVLAAVLGPSLLTTVVVIGVTVWARYARVVRADVLSLKQQDFILAARSSGVKHSRIIWRHLIPNVLGPIIVLASLGIGGIIILESALSFLGLGIQPPTPSWGSILADGRAHITRYPHISVAPGVMIVLTVLAFNFVGDGLRDALDPRQKDY